jgi:hypothetical protein
MRRFTFTRVSATLLAVMMLLPVHASATEVFDVAAGNSGYVPVTLTVGQYVSGFFSVTGDAFDQTIAFWVRDPKGTRIVDYGMVYSGGTEFNFTADQDGTYFLGFFNVPTLSNVSKTVTVTYDVTTPEVSGPDYIFISSVVAVILGLLLVFIFIAYDRRRSKPPVREVTRRPMVRITHTSNPATYFF